MALNYNLWNIFLFSSCYLTFALWRTFDYKIAKIGKHKTRELSRPHTLDSSITQAMDERKSTISKFLNRNSIHHDADANCICVWFSFDWSKDKLSGLESIVHLHNFHSFQHIARFGLVQFSSSPSILQLLLRRSQQIEHTINSECVDGERKHHRKQKSKFSMPINSRSSMWIVWF